MQASWRRKTVGIMKKENKYEIQDTYVDNRIKILKMKLIGGPEVENLYTARMMSILRNNLLV